MTESNTNRAFLAFGGNLGQPLAQFRQARTLLARHPQIDVVAGAPLYRTPAVGGPADQPDYLNSVVEINTGLTATELLRFCQSIENEAGRTRDVHWGPRTLDIDLLFHGDKIIDSPELTLPHPRLHERHFVLLPLNDLAPEFVHPRLDLSVAQLLRQLPPADGITQLKKTW